MIISASRRTDIPAFYSQWFIDCIQKGHCSVTNPFNPNQRKEVSLLPSDVDAIVFWTRYPVPLMKYLGQLTDSGYRYIFLYTITGYPSWLEPHSPELSHAIQAFKDVSRILGSQKVVWRYDPLVFSKELDFDFHIKNFAAIAQQLQGYTQRVIISIMEPYKKVTRRLKVLHEKGIVTYPMNIFGQDELFKFFTCITHIAFDCGMQIHSCCSNLTEFGIENGACIDGNLINSMFGLDLHFEKDIYQRTNCLCAKSVDIGTYNTCKFGCLYCYASR
ncbi:MAG TPA: DUF1848 domain-containing protein [Spirochaetota bacterium]|nr:DUF1848 domain-containing protein [Spirochaetota bacterium]HOM08828.1 DUF1848 domain-containing protein [Spirochaetota bacterium]HPP49386.1 DUF1848 domain-containing protein [Spirochaetota bacterium]HXK64921.1 DUF1848 domain-containing protein [Spirochaetota bacterium]